MQTRASFAASKSKNTIANNNNNNNNIDNDIGDEIYPVTTDNNTPRRAGSSRNQIRRESIKDSDYEVEDKFDDDDDDEDSPSSTVHVKNGRESEKSKCNKIAACEACRRVHRKCDGKLPKCSCCAQRGLKCVYLEPKKRGPVRGLSKQLKEQVQKLEQEITKLRQQNLTLMAQAPPSDESSTSSPSSPSPPSSIPSPSTSPSPSIMQNHGSTNTTTTTNNSALQHEAPFYNKIANLIEVYFSYINRVFPLVLRRTLDPALNVVLQQRGKHTMSPAAEALYPQIFLLYVILAISAQRTGDNVAEQFFLSKARTDVGKLYDCCSYDAACGFVLLVFYHLSEGHDAQAMLNLKLASEICKSMGAANMRGGGGRGSNLHKCVLLAKVLCEKNLSKKRKHLTQYFENTKFRYYSEDESEYEQPLMSCKSTSTTTNNNNNNNNNNAAASPSFSSLFNTKPPQVTLGLEKVIAIMSQVVSELETHEPHTIDYMAYSNILQALENYSNFVFDNDEMLLLQSTIQIWSARAMVLKNANLKSLSLEWCNKTTMLTRNSKFSMVCPTVVSPLRHVVDIHIDENCSQMLEEDFISWKQLYKRFKSAAPTMEKLRDYFNQNAKSFSKFLEQQETEDREEESRYRATYGQAATATATAAAAAAAQPPPPLPPPAIMNQQQQQQVPPPMQRQYSPQPIASPSSSSSSNSSNSHSNSNSNFFGHSFPPPAPPPQQQHLYHHHYTSNYQHGGYHHQHYHHHHHQHQHRYQQQPQPFRQPMAPSAAVQTQNSFFHQPHQHRGSSAIQQPYHHHHHEYQHQNGAGNNDNNNNIINNNNNNDNNNNGSVLEDLFGVDANQITQLEFDLMHSVE